MREVFAHLVPVYRKGWRSGIPLLKVLGRVTFTKELLVGTPGLAEVDHCPDNFFIPTVDCS